MVTITKNSETQQIITPYAESPEFGYCVVQSSDKIIRAGWISDTKRSAIIKAKIETLKEYISAFSKDGINLPGRIAVNEFREDELPKSFESRMNQKELDFEKRIKPFVKLSGKNGIELTSQGQRILRFCDYDSTGLLADNLIEHDNGIEIRATKVKTNTFVTPEIANLGTDQDVPF